MTYAGPAGVILTRDDCLIVWALLELNARADNAELRRRLKEFLEG